MTGHDAEALQVAGHQLRLSGPANVLIAERGETKQRVACLPTASVIDLSTPAFKRERARRRSSSA